MAVENLLCWNCGAALAAVPLPFGRRAECPRCESFLHCCRQCNYFDPNASKDCREPSADEVVDKEQGNFCDYFEPRRGLSAQGDPAAAAARAKLAAAFEGKAAPPPAGAEPPAHGHGKAEAEAARRKLEAVFGKGKG